MKKYVFVFIFSILFVGIILFQYSENYKFRIKPPSNAWSKELLLGSVDGSIKTYPRMMEFVDESYLIAYQNGEDISLQVVDKLGRKKNEIVIPVGDKFIRNINLVGDGEHTYITWITSQKGIKTMYSTKIDRNLEVIEENKEVDVQEASQIDDNILVLTYMDKIVVRDIKNNISTAINVTTPALVSGVNTNQGYLITYHESGRYFKYFFVRDGAASDIGLAAALSPDAKGGFFDRTTLGSDNRYAYLMVEAKTAEDRYGTIKCITFSLDGKEQNISDLSIGPFRSLFGAVPVSSGDQVRFLAGCTRYYERKDTQEDIIDFTIKNRAIIKYEFASRTKEPAMYPAGVDNALIFFNYVGTNKYDVYMASMDKEFKDIHDLPRESERSSAVSDTLLGFIYSIIFIFLFGLKWILFGLTAICGVTYFAHSMKVKVKKILYILSYMVLAAIKIYTMYGFSQEIVFPEAINSPIFIIGSCLIISLLCMMYGYRKYRNNIEALPLWSYVQAMLIDTLLTQMIFIPYIY